MWLFIVILAAAVIYFVFARGKNGGRRAGGPAESALDIIKTRYARGEITREEYERLKKDLE